MKTEPGFAISLLSARPRHLQLLLAMERESFDRPWGPLSFKRRLQRRCVAGFIAKAGRRAVGFVIVERRKRSLVLVNMVVRPRYRRRGLATAMLFGAVTALVSSATTAVTASVSEYNVASQLFLKSCGFVCEDIKPGHDGDHYRFTMVLEE